jgi:UDP-glucuronate 4-epimerase
MYTYKNKIISNNSPLTWIITGAAGFIGMHTSLRLLERGDKIIGIDNLNDYYDESLKRARLAQLQNYPNFIFKKLDISDSYGVATMFNEVKPDRVIHLAAQAGVRHSISNPHTYIKSNILGFTNILEGCRHNGVQHLIYASSSSVYGGNTSTPFSEHQNIDHPVSLYAATKKSNELMAHTYSHLFNLPTTGLRFFTVYGPWGRPDMALFLFTKAILRGESIEIYNHGKMERDFTFIDDIVEGIILVAEKSATPDIKFDPAKPDPAISNCPYRVFNIGNNQPVSLMELIKSLEKVLGIEAIKKFLPMQLGDVPYTAANTDELFEWIGFKPNTKLSDGIVHFVEWYQSYNNNKKLRLP